MKYNLYVWTGFEPDYTDGLAFAIATSKEEAQKVIADKKRTTVDRISWGKLSVRSVTQKVSYYVNGGG